MVRRKPPVFVILFALWLAWGQLPYSWGHYLTPACEWQERRLIGLYGAFQDDDAVWARAKCKGAASRSPLVSEFLAKFPTPAERAAWRD